MAKVNTHKNETNPKNSIPKNVQYAFDKLKSTQFCKLESNLTKEVNDEYSLLATICYPQDPVCNSKFQSPEYKVKILIPIGFPNEKAHIIPADGTLRWYPHQNGDWPLQYDAHANVICPPQLQNISINEWLNPYIREAYNWITDALESVDKIAKPGDRYEIPHFISINRKDKFFICGGRELFNIITQHKFGSAKIHLVETPPKLKRIHQVINLEITKEKTREIIWESNLVPNAFGKEMEEGWAAWVYAGSPVVKAPHQPPLSWSCFSENVEKRIWSALKNIKNSQQDLPFLLLAFEIPEQRGKDSNAIFWAALDLQGYDRLSFKRPAGRRRKKIKQWPKIKRFKKDNRFLNWVDCIDVSIESLNIRSGKSGLLMKKLNMVIIGLGALGGTIAKSMSKLGFNAIHLIDFDLLNPGNLVRHEGLSQQVQQYKVDAMSTLIQNPVTKISASESNILTKWENLKEHLQQADIIFDATANLGVHKKLSESEELVSKTIVWAFFKPGPKYGLLAIKSPESKATLDEAKEKIRTSLTLEQLDDYEKADSDLGPVFPEIGCYDPTFSAPYYRVRMMADSFISVLVQWLNCDRKTNLVTLFKQGKVDGCIGIESKIEKQTTF